MITAVAWLAYGAAVGTVAALAHPRGWWRRPTDPPARTAWWLIPATTTLAAGLWASHLPPVLQLGWALALIPLAAMLGVEAAVRRIPNLLSLAATAAAIAALAGAALTGHVAAAAVAAGIGVGAGLLYLAGARIRAGIGLGDVKLVPSLAALVALDGPALALWAVLAAHLLTALHALVLAARSGRGLATRAPHGPWLAVGCVLAMLLGATQ